MYYNYRCTNLIASTMSCSCLHNLFQVGACIVDKNQKIVGIGYNGFPIRISDDDPRRTWGKIPMGPTEEDKNKVGK